MEKVAALRANRRSFDCASRDEAATGCAQDDNFYINQSFKFMLQGATRVATIAYPCEQQIPPLRCAPVVTTPYVNRFRYT
jgi:hypothetical protein